MVLLARRAAPWCILAASGRERKTAAPFRCDATLSLRPRCDARYEPKGDRYDHVGIEHVFSTLTGRILPHGQVCQRYAARSWGAQRHGFPQPRADHVQVARSELGGVPVEKSNRMNGDRKRPTSEDQFKCGGDSRFCHVSGEFDMATQIGG